MRRYFTAEFKTKQCSLERDTYIKQDSQQKHTYASAIAACTGCTLRGCSVFSGGQEPTDNGDKGPHIQLNSLLNPVSRVLGFGTMQTYLNLPPLNIQRMPLHTNVYRNFLGQVLFGNSAEKVLDQGSYNLVILLASLYLWLKHLISMDKTELLRLGDIL